MKSGRKFKVLFVTEFLPWPLNSGGRIRTYNLLKQISFRHNVTVLASNYGGEIAHFKGHTDNLCIVHSRPKTKFAKIIGALFYIITSLPYVSVYSHFRKGMALSVQHAIQKNCFDLIHLDHLDAAVYLPYCKGVPVYIDQHNFETELLRSVKDSTKNPFLRWYLKRELKKLAFFERRVLNEVDAIGAVSERDADLIRKIAKNTKIEVIPNGVDLEYFTINRNPQPYKIVSVGSLDWQPNVEGLLWFLNKVWPRILDKCPQSVFHIVGRYPPTRLTERQNEKIRVHGTVPDIRDFVADASIFVVPLFAGGGTRLKVLEAMAMQIPIVSTPVGVEGIDCKNGRDVFIAKDDEEFCKKILDVLNEKSLADRLAWTGRNLVEKKYSWDVIGEKLNKFYLEILQ